MTYYLLDHPNPNGDHFYTTRRKPLIAIVVHITASIEDIDLIGPDRTCEAEAKYAATTSREVSWHSGSDTDSYIDLLPYSYTAFQCINYNSSTAGHEISKSETDWRDDDPEVIRRRLNNAADAIRPKAEKYRIPYRKATKAEVDNAIANGGPPVGFISHHELDPTRRIDPGWVNGVDTFPWTQFFTILRNGSQNSGEDLSIVDPATKQYLDAKFAEIGKGLGIIIYGDDRLDKLPDTHPFNLQAFDKKLDDLQADVDALKNPSA